MARSEIKTSFEMSLDKGWVVNFIENEDGTKSIEIGTENCYPVHIHFGIGGDGAIVEQHRWIDVYDTFADAEIPAKLITWKDD